MLWPVEGFKSVCYNDQKTRDSSNPLRQIRHLKNVRERKKYISPLDIPLGSASERSAGTHCVEGRLVLIKQGRITEFKKSLMTEKENSF